MRISKEKYFIFIILIILLVLVALCWQPAAAVVAGSIIGGCGCADGEGDVDATNDDGSDDDSDSDDSSDDEAFQPGRHGGAEERGIHPRNMHHLGVALEEY